MSIKAVISIVILIIKIISALEPQRSQWDEETERKRVLKHNKYSEPWY